jgi:hypothetical protein
LAFKFCQCCLDAGKAGVNLLRIDAQWRRKADDRVVRGLCKDSVLLKQQTEIPSRFPFAVFDFNGVQQSSAPN